MTKTSSQLQKLVAKKVKKIKTTAQTKINLLNKLPKMLNIKKIMKQMMKMLKKINQEQNIIDKKKLLNNLLKNHIHQIEEAETVSEKS